MKTFFQPKKIHRTRNHFLLAIAFVSSFSFGYFITFTTKFSKTYNVHQQKPPNISSLTHINPTSTAIKTPQPPHQRIVLMNRHSGVSMDFTQITNALNLTFSEFNPNVITNYGQSVSRAEYLQSFASFLCTDGTTTLVVGDTIPDARFLIRRLLDKTQPSCGLEKVVFWNTNRFDFSLDGDEEYYGEIRNLTIQNRRQSITMMNDAALRSLPIIHWVPNNPYEIQHWNLTLKTNMPDVYTMIRPFGFSKAPPWISRGSDTRSSKAAFITHWTQNGLIKKFEKMEVEIEFLAEKYGGPKNLKGYKFIVEIPYQASTMKQYENLREGVISFIPTYRFLRYELSLSWEYYKGMEIFKIINLAKKQGDPEPWKTIEYYCDEMKDFYYTFDSFEELKTILDNVDKFVDYKDVGRRGPAFIKAKMAEGIVEWEKILLRRFE